MSENYSVIIVNYEADVEVRRLRKELQGQGNPQVIVIDAKAEGLGYGAALNKGMQEVTSKHAVCMNPDISLKKRALPLLIETLEKDPSCGMVGPQTLDSKGKTQITCSQVPNAWQAAVIWSWIRNLNKYTVEKWYRLQGFDHTTSRIVPSVGGACFAIRTNDWKAIGGADEHLFLYFEEFDLALRLKAIGKNIRFCAESVITHFGQVSTNQVKNTTRIFIQSRKYWLTKHFGFSGWLSSAWLELWEHVL
jgi:GT2 family glycosyltransferase